MYRSISEAIIYGTAKEVHQLIPGAELNKIDDYGYSPLIQTAIVDDIEKAQIILNAGADVNFADLTGRTPLHWATYNNNIKLCQLLLKKGANPNAYTTAGQPVLVIPILRNYKKVKSLINKQGGNIDFAMDFINSKLLGHRFELKGQVDIVDNTKTFIEIDYEGFYLEFTIALILNSMVSFKNNYAARKLRKFFNHLSHIIYSYQIASELIKYQHYNIDINAYQNTINQLLDYPLRLIPVAYTGHAISLLQFGPFFARCDRGAYGKKHGTVIIYSMKKPEAFTKQFIKDLIYTRQSKQFIEEGIIDLLGLEPITTLPLSTQTAGNCSWANIEGAFPTLLYFLLLHEARASKQSEFEQLKKTVMDLYEAWVEWDKRLALLQCIDAFKTANKARRASKAAVLAAIFFQACDPQNSQDIEKIRKILPIIANTEYRYILKSYIDVYSKDPEFPETKRLLNILDEFGVDVRHHA